MGINGLLQPEDIIPLLKASDKQGVLGELADKAAERHPALDRQEIFGVLLEREKLGSTGIGDGIAIPHGKLRGIDRPILAFGRSTGGVEFNAVDGKPVKLFFLVIAPEEAVGMHLKMLARISRLLKDPAVRRGLIAAPDSAAICAIISEQDTRS